MPINVIQHKKTNIFGAWPSQQPEQSEKLAVWKTIVFWIIICDKSGISWTQKCVNLPNMLLNVMQHKITNIFGAWQSQHPEQSEKLAV